MKTFKLRGREYWHVKDGWCLRKISGPGGVGEWWRVFWGLPGPSGVPSYVNPYFVDGKELDFEEVNDLFCWLESKDAIRTH